MNAAMTIAARDLRSSFLSPKAGAIFFFFLIFMGVFFHNFVSFIVEAQHQAPSMGGKAPSINELINGLFETLHFVLILIVPAITMGTFAEEKKSQSFRLLQTAPISPAQIVFGKFFATAGLMGLLLTASLAVPLYLIGFGNPDIGHLFSAYLGMFLLICSQLSFGIWVSSMTKNQIMAFVFTMFGLFFLLLLNWLAQDMSSSDTTQTILKYVASSGHLSSFLKGMITVADTAYFILFSALFLLFTSAVVESQRWR